MSYIGYACKALGRKIYDEIDDLENQLLEIWEYEGTYEEALKEKKGYTQEEMESKWLEKYPAFSTYNHELCLKDLITEEIDKDLTATVQVSNGDNFSVSIGYGGGYIPYEITEFGGEYTFEAELPDGRTGKLTVLAQKTGSVVNPYGENDWEIAWTYTSEGWSELIENDGETALEGDIVAKFYKTENEVTPPTYKYITSEEITLPTGPEYKLVIEGTEGEMGDLYGEAWQKYGITANVNSDIEFLYPAYVTEVIICDEITNISFWALHGFLSLENIKIANTVTKIGEYSMANCKSLTSISIPDSVTNIGAGAFQYSGLTSIEIPEEVTAMEGYTFTGCEDLTQITIPDSVQSIGENEFQNCTSLSEITIPESVTSLGKGAFSGCTNLTQIKLSDNITSIGEEAFKGCTGLSNITLPSKATSIGKYAFQDCTNISQIIIPDGVTELLYGAFQGCTSLESVTIAGTVETMENFVFKGCTKLTSVDILYGVTTVGPQVFQDCTALANVTIPESVKTIKANAFDNCTSLKEITLPSSVTSIVSGAFLNIAEGSKIKVPTQAVKDLFVDGDNYDSTKTEIEIVQ